MTLLNVHVQADRAMVMVDTTGYLADDPADAGFQCSKILPLVHADTVFAARGQVALMWSAWSQFFLARDTHFDAIATAMLGMLKSMVLETQRTAPHILQAGAFRGTSSVLELVVVGRSREAGGKLQAKHWTVDSKGEIQGPVEIEGSVAPLADEASRPAALPDSLADWVKLARVQVADWRRIMPGTPIGGSLLVAELSDGLHVRNLGRI